MFPKVLRLTAFAVGGLFAVKLVFMVMGVLVGLLFKLLTLAVLALGIYFVYQMFVSAKRSSSDDGDDIPESDEGPGETGEPDPEPEPDDDQPAPAV